MRPLTKLVIGVSCLLSTLAAGSDRGEQAVRAQMQRPQERSLAPVFRLANGSGKRVALDEFRGQPVVLNLWATECGGCIAELPTFKRMDERYKGQGLTVIGVSLDVAYSGLKSPADGWAKVRPFVLARDMKYSILLDDGTVEKIFKVTALPATYVIDRAGRIAAAYAGVVEPADLEAKVKAVLAER